jgi:hypothetical protein
MANYVLWTRHGERGIVMEDNEEEEDDNNIPVSDAGQAFVDTLVEDADEEEMPEDGHVDDLGQVLNDAQRDCKNDNEKAKLQRMIEDQRKLLYPDCKQGHKKLGNTLEMLQWKEKYGVSDKAFEWMLKFVKDKLPENNELPLTTYEVKQTVCPLGLEVQKIHAYLMIAFYIKANTIIWKLVLCAKSYVIRSGEMMILMLSRGHLPKRQKYQQRLCGIFL